ncbi:PadR family transcriptional regulator [Gudongella sp. DL1XJH-153]|uniref:PadR family transcriptional regulator n=1 Tax=Gudongella sp. DL1XJH-153 TaxID=3409804 RepID=UPI003BB5CEC0
MPDKVLRKVFLGFIHIHILHHAKEEPFYGSWMIHELQEHGYSMSPGTLYPLLSGMESDGLLTRDERNVEGRVRKYYSITEKGDKVLYEAIERARELFKEIES